MLDLSSILFSVGITKDSGSLEITREQLVPEVIQVIKISGHIVANQLISEPWCELTLQIIDGCECALAQYLIKRQSKFVNPVLAKTATLKCSFLRFLNVSHF